MPTSVLVGTVIPAFYMCGAREVMGIDGERNFMRSVAPLCG
jgi:hypothetical protein